MSRSNKTKIKQQARARRQRRIRARVSGTPLRPRLSVFRSLRVISVQLIDDVSGKTLAAASSLKLPKGADAGDRKGKVAQSFLVGKKIAELAKAKNITTVVFDRGGYQYHGRVQAVADGAREGGLKF